jgi:hypothetical protein
VHLSGYFEPNNSLEEGMYGDEMEDDDDEDDDDLADKLGSDSDEDDEIIAKIKGKSDSKKNGSKDIQGFDKGGDLEK